MAYSAIMLFAKVKRPEPAAKKLGWEEIDCIFTDLSETDRELWEIDENLVRAELTTAEKREHLKRRKEVWERRQKEARDTGGKSLPTSLADGRKAGLQQEKSFAADTAEKTGMST